VADRIHELKGKDENTVTAQEIVCILRNYRDKNDRFNKISEEYLKQNTAPAAILFEDLLNRLVYEKIFEKELQSPRCAIRSRSSSDSSGSITGFHSRPTSPSRRRSVFSTPQRQSNAELLQENQNEQAQKNKIVQDFLSYYSWDRKNHCISKGRSDAWRKRQESGQLPTLEEIIFYAMAHPGGRTDTILKEYYGCNVHASTSELSPKEQEIVTQRRLKKRISLQAETHQELVKKTHQKVWEYNSQAVKKFLEESNTQIKGKCFKFSGWAWSKPENVKLTSIIDYSRKGWLPWFFSFIPGIYSGTRTYNILREKLDMFDIDTREKNNAGKSSAQIAVELYNNSKVQGPLRR
ncbi:MAG: hypothetical protein K0S63_380, partial [Gammaproteobacteria bacterium]|nr:hypothetical protein [Gammaproteobacteria bacterium]